MRVTFANFGDNIASSRLRAAIPQNELAKLGIEKGRDILVYSKHIVPIQMANKFSICVYDICDDHFSDVHSDYYMEHTATADLVTVNTPVMAEIVKKHTGRDSVIIPDPYEAPEKPPGFGSGILWYGHESNIKDLVPYKHIPMNILTGSAWSMERQREELAKCAVVFIPTGNRLAKSNNRLLEAIRNGRYVVAGNLPAYEEFKDFVSIGGNLENSLESALHQPEKCIQSVRECQAYIRDRYSPETIGKLWKEALDGIWTLTTH